MKVSVCICTYLRDALLQRVLESLKQADLAGIAADTEVEILVVDNHPGGETAALCERVAAALPQSPPILPQMLLLTGLDR